MNIYDSTCEFMLGLPLVQAWPEMQILIERAVARQDPHWQLPLLTCRAVGGDVPQAVPAVAAVACLHLSFILIDDLLDADPRGEYRRIGAPAAANLAAAFQSASMEAILQADARAENKLAALHSVNQAALLTPLGQHLDVQNPADEMSYWRVVETKSAPFFAAAFHIGALLAGAPAGTCIHLKQLGELYGEMIQIYDDLHDTLSTPANPDWTLGRSPLPILYAMVVEHVDQARFHELRRAASDPQALAEAQAILIRCGAISYGVYQLLQRHHKAEEALRGISLKDSAGLEILLESLIAPVQKMFQAIGVAWPDSVNEAAQIVWA